MYRFFIHLNYSIQNMISITVYVMLFEYIFKYLKYNFYTRLEYFFPIIHVASKSLIPGINYYLDNQWLIIGIHLFVQISID